MFPMMFLKKQTSYGNPDSYLHFHETHTPFPPHQKA
jgi:hypothetical protein